jgi:hypothetical protein
MARRELFSRPPSPPSVDPLVRRVRRDLREAEPGTARISRGELAGLLDRLEWAERMACYATHLPHCRLRSVHGTGQDRTAGDRQCSCGFERDRRTLVRGT